MKLNFEAKIIDIKDWRKSDEPRKDVIVIEQQSMSKLSLLCEEKIFSLLRKCKKGALVKVDAKLKATNMGSYERNYIIIQNIISMEEV
ncbi:MAG: hypothetical protein PF517_04700 [Salinivirgaceae bacterium]|jgi:hypothetical protein|nr:hypothetical protein [Salinivirgaceae bacterium]